VCENQPAFVPLLTGHMVGGFNVMVRKNSGGCGEPMVGT